MACVQVVVEGQPECVDLTHLASGAAVDARGPLLPMEEDGDTVAQNKTSPEDEVEQILASADRLVDEYVQLPRPAFAVGGVVNCDFPPCSAELIIKAGKHAASAVQKHQEVPIGWLTSEAHFNDNFELIADEEDYGWSVGRGDGQLRSEINDKQISFETAAWTTANTVQHYHQSL